MTQNLSPQYWSNRYQTNDFTWDIGNISTPLKEYINQLTDKNIRILIPGAGNAYEAEYLYNLGFKNVVVLDYALEPLQNFATRLPDFPKSDLIQQDFFEHTNTYDLIIEQTFFCALNPDLRKNYVQHIHSLLKPNGKLAGVLFNDVLNTDKPPFGGNKEEYEQLFKPYFDFKVFENCYNSIKPRFNRELFIIFNKRSL